MIKAPISIGELIDKITILEIKAERIDCPEKRAHVLRELGALKEVETLLPTAPPQDEIDNLRAVNGTLWAVEDAIRLCDRFGDFGDKFVSLAQCVYKTNDRRSEIKRRINEACGSEIVEAKQYAG